MDLLKELKAEGRQAHDGDESRVTSRSDAEIAVNTPDENPGEKTEDSNTHEKACVRFVTKEEEPFFELEFKGLYEPNILADSAVVVLNHLKKKKLPAAEINDFLMLVCSAFGLPTDIVNKGSGKSDDILDLARDQAESLSVALNQKASRQPSKFDVLEDDQY